MDLNKESGTYKVLKSLIKDALIEIKEEEDKSKIISNCYKDAKRHLVFRLSELMFGSLLASYILGFIAISFSSSEEYDVLKIITYCLISLSFSFLTAGFYISYHIKILTIPTKQSIDANWDFLFAISQAIFFGLSILFPFLFAFSISVMLFITMLIQRREFKRFIEFNYNHANYSQYSQSKMSSDFSKRVKSFRKERKTIIIKTLQTSEFLKNWLPIALWIKIFTTILCIFSVIFSYIYINSRYKDLPYLNFKYSLTELIDLTFYICIVITAGIVISVMILLSKKGNFVSEENLTTMDVDYNNINQQIHDQLTSLK